MNWDEWFSLFSPVVGSIIAQFQPNILVPAMNGGLIPAGIIAARLGIKDVRPVSIGRRGEERYFLYPDQGEIGDIQGARILIVEDDVPTGMSIMMAQEHFLSKGAAEVKIACIFKGKDIQGIDFFAQEMDPKLFPKYPWKVTNLGDRT
jgi:hypoxanthine phosphoribosyltransferase